GVHFLPQRPLAGCLLPTPPAVLRLLALPGPPGLLAGLPLGLRHEAPGRRMAIPDGRDQPGRRVGDLARPLLGQPVEVLARTREGSSSRAVGAMPRRVVPHGSPAIAGCNDRAAAAGRASAAP